MILTAAVGDTGAGSLSPAEFEIVKIRLFADQHFHMPPVTTPAAA